jgi:glycosyltransferase involved in cell wall biosynthesis
MALSEATAGEPAAGAAPEAVLSVVIPCFNEVGTIVTTGKRVLASAYTVEVIVVDDGFSDGSADAVEALDVSNLRVLRQGRNQGKGAASRRGFADKVFRREVLDSFTLEEDRLGVEPEPRARRSVGATECVLWSASSGTRPLGTALRHR